LVASIFFCFAQSQALAAPGAPWADKTYQPEFIDNYMHIREGIASVDSYGISYGSAPVLGTSTCDAVFIYAIAANKQLTNEEMESCALQEYEIFKRTKEDNRNFNDAFVKKEIIDQFTKVALDRMEELKKTKLFYMRAVAIQIDQLNISNYSIKIRANIQLNGSFVSGNTRGYYSFDEPHKVPSDSRWIEGNISGIPADDAREIESARANNRFRTNDNIVKFEVIGAREMGDQRLIKIKIKEFSVFYKNSKGDIVSVGFGSR
jgi:hypothetical protein